MRSNYGLWLTAVGLALSAVACGSDGGENEDRGPCACEDGITPPPVYTPVDWDEESPLGITPRDAFDGYAKECTGTLSWDASPLEANVTPESGTTDLTETITVDESSARVSDCMTGACDLQATAHVTIASADGVFMDEGDVTTRYTPDRTVSVALSFAVHLPDSGGSLSIPSTPGSEGLLDYTVYSKGCRGSVSLSVSWPNENGHGGKGVAGSIGNWNW